MLVTVLILFSCAIRKDDAHGIPFRPFELTHVDHTDNDALTQIERYGAILSLMNSHLISNYTMSPYLYISRLTGNSMVVKNGTPKNGMMFTTRDRDNDISSNNCGNSKKGWWHAGCTYANLNGGVYTYEFLETAIHWKTWKQIALKGTRIMIKPKP
ncbi:Hypothetical predicted protein [Mytilus galloprovincialis]|uniref:Fibrinogen C-terminal domain-containing protein n=1 Tax=Mytilus galloprovincialis TaxID=29158 RepID=A0A8B6F3S1_MYTGA|nr:Hypothetical predicted protein [Mytilus galloprovincialis]